MIRVETPRLELVAATAETIRMEMGSIDRLADHLGATMGGDWPPPLNDDSSLRFALHFAEQNPGAAGFGLWYFLLRDPPTVIGNGGCKGTPRDGVVEIGYSLFPAFHGHGYATEAVRGLLSWLFDHQDVHTVIAETLPDLTSSIRVLERTGFALVDGGSEPGVIRYALKRSGVPGVRVSS